MKMTKKQMLDRLNKERRNSDDLHICPECFAVLDGFICPQCTKKHP